MSLEQVQFSESENAEGRSHFNQDHTRRLVNMSDRNAAQSTFGTSDDQSHSILTKHGEMTLADAYSTNGNNEWKSNDADAGGQHGNNSLSNDLGYLSSAAYMIAGQAAMLSQDAATLGSSATSESGIAGKLMNDIAQLGKADTQFLADLSQLFDGSAGGAVAGDTGSAGTSSTASTTPTEGSTSSTPTDGSSTSTTPTEGSTASATSTAGSSPTTSGGGSDTTSSSPSDTQPATSGNSFTLYNDGQMNWAGDFSSNASINYHDTTGDAPGGGQDIEMTPTGSWALFQPYSGVPANFNDSAYTNLTFEMKGNGDDYQMVAHSVDDQVAGPGLQLAQYAESTPEAGQWTKYSVPLSALGVAGGEFYKFLIQDDAANPAGPTYFDNIQFTNDA